MMMFSSGAIRWPVGGVLLFASPVIERRHALVLRSEPYSIRLGRYRRVMVPLIGRAESGASGRATANWSR